MLLTDLVYSQSCAFRHCLITSLTVALVIGNTTFIIIHVQWMCAACTCAILYQCTCILLLLRGSIFLTGRFLLIGNISTAIYLWHFGNRGAESKKRPTPSTTGAHARARCSNLRLSLLPYQQLRFGFDLVAEGPLLVPPASISRPYVLHQPDL